MSTSCPSRRTRGDVYRSGLYRPCRAAWPRAHSAPRFSGCSGFPSSLMARPSRVSAMTPHAAAHSRQVVAKYVETPGTVWSGLTRYGMSRPASLGPQPAAAAPAPVTPRIFRNSRRRTPVGCVVSLIGSVVAHAAVVADLSLHVTVDAPPHVERLLLVHGKHVLHLAVTRLTGDAGIDVPHVREVHVVGHLVDAHPRNRLILRRELLELRDFRSFGAIGAPRADDRVTPHAGAHGGESRIGRFVRGVVAVQAIHLQRHDVRIVREADWLFWSASLGSGPAADG